MRAVIVSGVLCAALGCASAPLVPSTGLKGARCDGQGLPEMALVQCEVPGEVAKLRVDEVRDRRIVLVAEARTGDERGWFVAGVDGPLIVDDLAPGAWEIVLRSASGEVFPAGGVEVPRAGGVAMEDEPGFETMGNAPGFEERDKDWAPDAD